MKLNSSTRLAMAAGLCAAVALGSVPAAIAAEPGAAPEPAVVQAEGNQGGGSVSPADVEVSSPAEKAGAITSFDALSGAIAGAPDGVETTVVLEGDIVFSNGQIVTVPKGKVIVLDMAGHKITVTEDFVSRPFVNEGTLTVKGDGVIDTTASVEKGYGAINNKGTLTIVNGTFKGSRSSNGSAIRNTGSDAKVHVIDGDFYGTGALFNEGTAIIDGGRFMADSCNTCASGIYSYALNSDGAAAKMTVNGGTVIGVHGGLAVAGGEAVVNGGAFKSVKCKQNHPNASGTFYALYVAGHVGETSCVVNGGTFETEGAISALHIGNDAVGDGGIAANATARINGGTFKSPAGVPVLIGAKKTGDPVITAGTFLSGDKPAKIDAKYLAPGLEVDQTTGQVVENAAAVATVSVNGQLVGAFTSLKEAVAAAPKGSQGQAPESPAVITLLKDTNDGFDIGDAAGKTPQNVVLDLNGKTLTLGPSIGSKGTETNGLRVLAYSKLHIKNGAVTNNDVANAAGKRVAFLLVNYSEMTLTDVKVTPVLQAELGINNRGKLTLEGATTVETAKNGLKLAITNDPYNYFYTDFDASINVPEGSDVKVGKVQIERYGNTQNKGGVALNIASGEFGEFVEDGKDAAPIKGNITGGAFAGGIKDSYLAPDAGMDVQPDGTVAVHVHKGAKVDAVAATCETAGNLEHWKCTECGKTFSDDAMTDEIDVVVPAKGHNVKGAIHHKAVEPTTTDPGMLEHWECPDCHKLFRDADLTKVATAAELTVPAVGVTKVTATFEAGNGVVYIQSVPAGSKLVCPETPVKDGWEFVGWFKTKAANGDVSDKWNFDEDVVTADITLYGGWVKKGAGQSGTSAQKPTAALPQTGDASMLPIVASGVAGVAAIGAGAVIIARRRKAE